MRQLLFKNILEKALDVAPKNEIVCRNADGESRLTYAELYDRVSQTANALERLGVERGDAVSTYAPNSQQHLELSFAVPMVGARYHAASLGQPQENIASLHRRIPKEVVLTEAKYLEVLEQIDDDVDVGCYVVLDGRDVPETTLSSVYAYEELLDDSAPTYTFPDVDESETAILANSTGTTGDPKIFDYNQRAHLLYAIDCAKRCGLDREDTILVTPPLWYHNAWSHQYIAALVGATLVVPRRDEAKLPSGQQAAELIEQEDVTFTGGLSTIVPRWTNAWREADAEYDLRSLERVLIVGTSLTQTPESVLREFVDRTEARLIPSAGYSEVVSLYSIGPMPDSTDWEDQQELVYTGGLVDPLIEVKVVDPDTGEEVPKDGQTRGSIGIRGPYVTDGYHDPEKMDEKTDEDGFLYPGDMGTITEDGIVTPLERVEDLINGEQGSISPSRLSGIVSEQPWTNEVATVGIPSGDHEAPVVFVVLKRGYENEVGEETVRSVFEGEIPDWQIPAAEIIDEIPIGKRGKRDPRILKEEYADEYGSG